MIEKMEILQVLDLNLDTGSMDEDDELKFSFVVKKGEFEEIYDDDEGDDITVQVIECNRNIFRRTNWGSGKLAWYKDIDIYPMSKTDCYGLIAFNVEKFKNGNIKNCILKKAMELQRAPPNKARKNGRKSAKRVAKRK